MDCENRGRVIRVHLNDVDPWPSIPHSHIINENLVVDKDGNIFDSRTRQQVDRLSKRERRVWNNELNKRGCL